jgi:excisionase family DNA binding protein
MGDGTVITAGLSAEEFVERVARRVAEILRDEVAPPPPPPARADLLTVAEVADELKVAEDTVREWIRAGDLPATRPGGPKSRVWRVGRAELDAFKGARPADRNPLDPRVEAERILSGGKKGRR